MDVTTINTSYNTSVHVPAAMQADKTPVEIPSAQREPKIAEKVMMDLQDVQNFLYMLIGSEIRVESDKNALGLNINTAA